VAARRKKMTQQADELEVVAAVRTSGSLGEHCIELLSCGDPQRVYVRFDGERSMREFLCGASSPISSANSSSACASSGTSATSAAVHCSASRETIVWQMSDPQQK